MNGDKWWHAELYLLFTIAMIIGTCYGMIKYAEYRDNSTPPIHELRDDCRVYEKEDATYTLCGPPWVHGDSGVTL